MSIPPLSWLKFPSPNSDPVEVAPKPLQTLEAQVEELANQQEKVAEFREQVLVDRGKIKTSGKHVHRQREIVGRVEAKLMDAFREHYNSLATPLPISLTTAYVSVENERERLVHLEDQYIQMQDPLGAAEWNLMDAETELYQSDLRQLTSDGNETEISGSVKPDVPLSMPLPTTIAPSLEVQHQVVVEKHRRVVRRFQDLREDYSIDIHFESDEDDQDIGSDGNCAIPLHLFDSVITQMIDLEIMERGLRSRLVPEEGPMISKVRHRSDAGTTPKDWGEDVLLMPRAHSDGGLPDVSDNLSNKHFVDHWLLECLKISSTERIQYKNILQCTLKAFDGTTFAIERWEELATKWWPSSMIDNLKWPSFAGSVVFKQTRLQDVSFVPRFTEDIEQSLIPTPPTPHIPKDERQLFLNEPRLETKLDRSYNAAVLSHLAAWIEVLGITMLVTEAEPLRIAQPDFSGNDATDCRSASTSRAGPLLIVPDSNCQAPCDSVYSISPSRSLCTVPSENEQSLGNGTENGKVRHDLRILPGYGAVAAEHSFSVGSMPNGASDEQSALSKSDTAEVSNAVFSLQETDIARGFTQDVKSVASDQDIRMMSSKNKAPVSSTYEKQCAIGAPHDCISNDSSDDRSDTSWASVDSQSTVSDVSFKRTRPIDDVFQDYLSHTELRQVPVHEHRDFFTLGRVIKMHWPTIVTQGLCLAHLPYRQPSPAGTDSIVSTGTRNFVVVKNRGNFSLCLPVQIHQGRAHVIVRSQRRDFGVILESKKPSDTSIRDFFNSYQRRAVGAEELDKQGPSEFRDPELTRTYNLYHDRFIQDLGRLDQEPRLELLDCFLGRSIEDDVSFPSWSRQHTG